MSKFYPRLFFVNFSAMFAGAAIFYLFKMPHSEALLAALYPAGLFAILMTFVVGPIHVALSKKIAGAGYGPEIYRTHQSVELSIGLDYTKLFSIAHRYLKEKAGFEILEADTRTWRISAKSPVSLKTFGNIITLEFTEAGTIFTNLKISSRPRIGTTMIDYGENLKIVLDAKQYLIQNAGQQ
ncbi:MAG TPA: hypothetical protein DCL44_03605 [Elusimicrobia bacterium]|nr:hypothetical protein [Elusimicrobiota bacterium]